MKTSLFIRVGQISAALIALSSTTLVTAQTPAKPGVADAKAGPKVTGKFIGNGKNALISFLLVEEEEAFGGKEAVKLIFTEKDPAKVAKPSFDAVFGKLGSALILSVDRDGGIFGCEVAHSAHEKRGFTSLGRIKMAEFKITDGNVTGHVITGGELDTFGEKWEVDLTFAAPMPAKVSKAPSPAKSPPKPVVSEAPKKEPKAPAGPLIAARKLPLPKDAADVEFNALVKQIHFSSAQPVDAVTKEFSANLKLQGWKDGAGSLMGKKNAILQREQDGAKLTIMIQPASSGSVVKIFADGLDWSGGSDAAPAVPKKATGGAADDFEAQAQKALKDALKGLPGGL